MTGRGTAWDEWEPYAAVLLAGGRSSRLDGVDKSGIELGGRTMLAWALDAVVDATEVVVVGDPVRTERPVTFVREDPRFGGPVAALLTGADALLAPRAYLGVVAVDMPFLRPRTLSRLREAAFGRDGAVLTGPDGRRQLALVLSAARLAEVRPNHEDQHGMPLRELVADLELVEAPSEGDEHRDVDTWTDLKSL